MIGRTRGINQPEIALDAGTSGLSGLFADINGDESAFLTSPAIEYGFDELVPQ